MRTISLPPVRWPRHTARAARLDKLGREREVRQQLIGLGRMFTDLVRHEMSPDR